MVLGLLTFMCGSIKIGDFEDFVDFGVWGVLVDGSAQSESIDIHVSFLCWH